MSPRCLRVTCGRRDVATDLRRAQQHVQSCWDATAPSVLGGIYTHSILYYGQLTDAIRYSTHIGALLSATTAQSARHDRVYRSCGGFQLPKPYRSAPPAPIPTRYVHLTPSRGLSAPALAANRVRCTHIGVSERCSANFMMMMMIGILNLIRADVQSGLISC